MTFTRNKALALVTVTICAAAFGARRAAAFDPCDTANCATITVDAGGNGSGRITSEPAGIDCRVAASVMTGTTFTGVTVDPAAQELLKAAAGTRLESGFPTIEHVAIQRMDHVGVVVDDLAAAAEKPRVFAPE